MTELVSIERDGAAATRAALERCVGGGGVAIFPAEGVYGLACDPALEEAIRRIHALKGRDERMPSAVMFFSPLGMRELIAGLGSRTRDALAALLPGPLTLVVHNPERRFPNACREDPERLGIRLISGPLAGVRCAVFQTSANRSGEPPPARFEGIDPELGAAVDVSIDGGELTGRPSTVVDLTAIESGGGWSVLREGAIAERELRQRLAAAGLAEGPPGRLGKP
jgi:L-threonylcarbamoyladenylate synthase